MNPFERLFAWLLDTPIHAQERELLREEARRLKIKTDLQEARIRLRLNSVENKLEEARKEIETLERMHTVAHIDFKYDYHHYLGNHLKCHCSIVLRENGLGQREMKILTKTNSIGQQMDTNDKEILYAFRAEKYYPIAIEPWLNYSISTDELKDKHHSVTRMTMVHKTDQEKTFDQIVERACNKALQQPYRRARR